MIVREATQGDILAVVQRMRASDAAEQFAVRFETDDEEGRLRLAYQMIEARRMAIKSYALAGADEAPIALVSAYLEAPFVASLHRVATDRYPEIARGEFRFLKREFIPFVLAPNVRFASAQVPADDAVTLRWLGALGFTPAGVPLPYGLPGRRFLALAWINPASPFGASPDAARYGESACASS